MRLMSASDFIPARLTGSVFVLLAATLLALAALPPLARAQPVNDHQAALSALSDLQAAIAEIVQADQSNSTDKKVYYRASQRAINALEGRHGEEFVAAAGTPGDEAGAIGHIDVLLDRKETPVWAGPLHGAEANMRVAIAHLVDARHAHELMDYDISASRALTHLLVARGRPNELGVFGGIEGALANTMLGVPAGAKVEDGCREPSSAPAYGVHGGYVAWVAVPVGAGTYQLSENPGGESVVVRNGTILLSTAASPLVTRECNSKAEIRVPVSSQPTKTAGLSPPMKTSAADTPPPALYTKDQAEAGAQVFATKCVSCHGANLQGTAAPSVAGTDFLTTAEHNGWTLEVIRYLVVNNMPLDAPGSLSPTQYADVLAFLLAANCYPGDSKPFPPADDPGFAKIKLGPVPGAHPGRNQFGVCPVG
jgi:polar amino acid transport system substrate-binding protein